MVPESDFKMSTSGTNVLQFAFYMKEVSDCIKLTAPLWLNTFKIPDTQSLGTTPTSSQRKLNGPKDGGVKRGQLPPPRQPFVTGTKEEHCRNLTFHWSRSIPDILPHPAFLAL